MRTIPVFKMLTLALVLTLVASSAQACGDKAEASSTGFQITVTGISAKTAPLIISALQAQLGQSGSPKSRLSEVCRRHTGSCG